MPDREMAMEAMEDYLRTRDEARKPQPIWSAKAVGVCLIILGAGTAALSWLGPWEGAYLRPLGYTLIPLGVALLLLGVKGTAKYRVTETTRYPQQTGEIVDMFYQILGGNFLWVVVAALILVVSFFALTMP